FRSGFHGEGFAFSARIASVKAFFSAEERSFAFWRTRRSSLTGEAIGVADTGVAASCEPWSCWAKTGPERATAEARDAPESTSLRRETACGGGGEPPESGPRLGIIASPWLLADVSGDLAG